MGDESGAETVNPPSSWDLPVLWDTANLPRSSPRSGREEKWFPGGLAPKRSLGEQGEVRVLGLGSREMSGVQALPTAASL